MPTHARILVADDDLNLLEAVATAVAASGAEVVRATSGAEMIIKVAEQGPFDLIVTDISMPWMSGLQAAHSARRAGHGTPIIVMTALRDRQLARLSGELRALGDSVTLLRKPFDLAELDQLVNTALQPS